MKKFTLRNLLLCILALIAISLLGNGVFMFANYFFEWRPDKISAELYSTLFLSGFSLIPGVIVASLFFGLLRKTSWFFTTYWIACVVSLVWLFIIMSPLEFSRTWEVFCIPIVLTMIGMFFHRNKKWLGFTSVA